ncbi:MAG: hypothetical protein CBE36_01055 [Oceanospirillaceae bacterium TMED276]|nr:MAG: hypothetical protein CBE36_01055 [Oceanospirillaceae bacterium TMED276]
MCAISLNAERKLDRSYKKSASYPSLLVHHNDNKCFMKKISLLVLSVFLAASNAWSATPEQLDQLLQQIKNDISAKRLSSPEGNNALEKITEFRSEAPFDYRVVPLAYDWGEAYVSLSAQAREKGQLSKAQGYLDKVWKVAALTPGLEDEQRALDQAMAKSGVDTRAVAAKEKADAEEQARQRELAAAAEKEKERLRIEAEKQRKIAAAEAAEKRRREAAEKARRAEQERQRRAEQERQRQLAAAAAAKQKQSSSSPVLNSPIDLDDIALDPVAPAPKPRPAAPRAAAKTPTAQSTRLWAQAKEESDAIAEYTVPPEALQSKDRAIAEKMGDICQKMVDEDASVVVHSAGKSDYRWLAVRLTLCARRIDRGYRLRHSYQPVDEGEPVIVALHPPRDSSLLKQVGQ